MILSSMSPGCMSPSTGEAELVTRISTGLVLEAVGAAVIALIRERMKSMEIVMASKRILQLYLGFVVVLVDLQIEL